MSISTSHITVYCKGIGMNLGRLSLFACSEVTVSNLGCLEEILGKNLYLYLSEELREKLPKTIF